MVYLPVIAAKDYEAFRTIMRDHLTYTYDEWLNLHAKWSRDYADDGITKVNVNPDQFSRYLSKTGRAPDMQTLLRFAESTLKGDED